MILSKRVFLLLINFSNFVCILGNQSNESILQGVDKRLEHEQNNCEKHVYRRFDELQKVLIDLKENLDSKLSVLDKFTELEQNVNEGTNELAFLKMISDLKKKINQQFNMLEKITAETQNVKKILSMIDQKLPVLKNSNQPVVLDLEKLCNSPKVVNQTLDASKKNCSDLGITNLHSGKHKNVFNNTEIIDDKLDPEESTTELKENNNRNLDKITHSNNQTGCKEYVAVFKVFVGSGGEKFAVDNKTFRHTILKKDDFGIEHFEMHIAIKSASPVQIMLSSLKDSSFNLDTRFYIDVGEQKHKTTVTSLTILTQFFARIASSALTPDIISGDHFTQFYLKISNNTLTFGKKGDSTPLLTYQDGRVRKIHYLQFGLTNKNDAWFLYDCPMQ